MVVIVGLLCLERDIRGVWFVLLLNVVITLAWQVRSEWLGLVLAVLTWAVLTGRLGRVIAMGIAVSQCSERSRLPTSDCPAAQARSQCLIIWLA